VIAGEDAKGSASAFRNRTLWLENKGGGLNLSMRSLWSVLWTLIVCVCGLTSSWGDVVINEIHYHPADFAVLEGENPDDLEFLELYNSGTSTVDLSGWSIGPGILHTFPFGAEIDPGEYIVLAEEPDFLQLRGPSIPPETQVIAWDSGGLSNGGELIQLFDDSGTPVLIDEVLYDDLALWPTGPDGAGPSLELIHPDFDNSSGLVWSGSIVTNGTPGASNSSFSLNPIVLREEPERRTIVDTLPQVSVTFSKAVSGVVAGNLTVDGSPATALNCSSCSAGVGAGPYVFSGYAVPSGARVTINLAQGSIQDTDTNPFPGDSWINALEVADLIINEIHYNPTGLLDDEEFIELYNGDSGSVDISGWRVTEFEDAGYVFPPLTTLAAGAYAVVAKNAIALETSTGFLTQYEWTAPGNLSNEDEGIRILDDAGVIVDRVVYDDVPPWPSEADGDGPSMELVHPSLDNSQAQAWCAATVDHGSPGAQNTCYSLAPIVISESPSQGSVVETLLEVAVNFSEPVQGVVASSLEVASSAATLVTCSTCSGGIGVGPYVFSGFTAPTDNPILVTLVPGSIEDVESNAFLGDSWVYLFDLPVLVINEILYNTTTSGDPEEFIELYNRDVGPVSLSDWTLSGFADTPFTFDVGTIIPANGYVVVAKDPAALCSATGYCTTPHQWPEGKLGDGGEPILLSDQYGIQIDFVEYEDGDTEPAWPVAADGDGPSLELVHPDLDNTAGQAWRASSSDYGTPGQANSQLTNSPIVMAENPPRGSIIGGVTEMSVTFSEPVTGVAPTNLMLNGVFATEVTGEGEGPYIFSVTSPPPGPRLVWMFAGSIKDLNLYPFAGDSWWYTNSQTTLSIPDDAKGGPGDTASVPIVASPANGILAANITIEYSATLLTALNVSKTPLSQAFTLNFDIGTPGVVSISLSGSVPMTGTGSIAEIQFDVLGSIGQSAALELTSATINAGEISVFLDDGLFTVCDNLDSDSDGLSICGGDCRDDNPNCTTNCTDFDTDDFCVTHDCDDNDVNCTSDCTDGDLDGIYVCGGDCDDGSFCTYPGAAPLDDTQACMRDCDGDNYGDETPAGGVTAGTDCDDTDFQSKPGATEVCDGEDNNCDDETDEGFLDTDTDGFADCVDPDDDEDGYIDGDDCAPLNPLAAVPPPEVIDVALQGTTSTTISWASQGGSMHYDVVSGLLSNMHSHAGVGDALCLREDEASASMIDPRPGPGSGEGYVYLVRAQEICTGSYGYKSSGPERLPTSDCF
jgi:hypothetical protein